MFLLVRKQVMITLLVHNYMHVHARPVAGGGGGGRVGGVPTPPSVNNDIHNFNYLIQERPFDCS